MQAQDYRGAVRWIVVDDGRNPQPVTFKRPGWSVEVIRPEPFWEKGQNTQARNLLAGLRAVRGGRVVIIEDDDYYGPGWLTEIDRALEGASVAGAIRSIYYNIATRTIRRLDNRAHASLCCTGVAGPGIDRLIEACVNRPKFIDLELWKRGGFLFESIAQVVGIKGLSGRENIGIGKNLTGSNDPDLSALRGLIGDDCEAYLPCA